MNGRGEAAGSRRAAGRLLLAAALLVIAAGVAACGGSSSSDIGSYLGLWQRVEGGTPNPDFTLTVAKQGDGGAVTFVNRTNGQSETVAATVEDGYLACTLPSGDDPLGQAAGVDEPSPGGQQAPSESDLQLSVDENGQLVVDLVLADGTTEPVWFYDRAPAASPAP